MGDGIDENGNARTGKDPQLEVSSCDLQTVIFILTNFSICLDNAKVVGARCRDKAG